MLDNQTNFSVFYFWSNDPTVNKRMRFRFLIPHIFLKSFFAGHIWLTSYLSKKSMIFWRTSGFKTNSRNLASVVRIDLLFLSFGKIFLAIWAVRISLKYFHWYIFGRLLSLFGFFWQVSADYVLVNTSLNKRVLRTSEGSWMCLSKASTLLFGLVGTSFFFVTSYFSSHWRNFGWLIIWMWWSITYICQCLFFLYISLILFSKLAFASLALSSHKYSSLVSSFFIL